MTTGVFSMLQFAVEIKDFNKKIVKMSNIFIMSEHPGMDSVLNLCLKWHSDYNFKVQSSVKMFPTVWICITNKSISILLKPRKKKVHSYFSRDTRNINKNRI